MIKKNRVEIRDLATFTAIMLIGIALYAAVVFVVLSDVASFELNQGNVSAASFIGYVGLSVLILSIIMIVLYFWIIGTMLKRLNTSNKWVKKNTEYNTASQE